MHATRYEKRYLLNLAIHGKIILLRYQTVLQQFYFGTFMACCMAWVALLIITISWSSGISRSINCDLLFHCKSLLKECDYSILQSVLMTKFWTDFMSSVWNFRCWVTYVPHKTSPSGNEQGGTSVFTGWVIEQLRCPFGFILLSFAMNVVMGYQGFQ